MMVLQSQDSVFHEKARSNPSNWHKPRNRKCGDCFLGVIAKAVNRNYKSLTTLPSKDLMRNCPQTDSTTISRVSRLGDSTCEINTPSMQPALMVVHANGLTHMYSSSIYRYMDRKIMFFRSTNLNTDSLSQTAYTSVIVVLLIIILYTRINLYIYAVSSA